ncbi:MAG: response regulator [Pseudomonadales bacterium]|nr:response regulator [Pseudomonadales bacterium]
MNDLAIMQPSENRLLCVDDSTDITDILQEIGIDAGYEVRVVNKFELITHEIDSFNPTVIFLDLNLGPNDVFDDKEIPREGLEILKYLAASKSLAKIVILSGMSRRSRELNRYLGRDLELNVVASVSKPFRADSIGKLLDKLKEEPLTASLI